MTSAAPLAIYPGKIRHFVNWRLEGFEAALEREYLGSRRFFTRWTCVELQNRLRSLTDPPIFTMG